MERLYLNLLPMLPAAILAVSDFREHRVSVPCVITFAACCATWSFIRLGWLYAILRFGVGTSLLLFFYLLLILYYRKRHGRERKILDDAFGKGDAAFLACTAWIFDAESLCLFVAASCAAGVVWHRSARRNDIPFVGVAVPVFIVFIMVSEYI